MKSVYHFLYQTSLVWKIAIASGLSWEVARMIGSAHPYLAPLSVILCLQITVGKSIFYGVERVLGTIAGVLFTVYLTPYIGLNAWSLGLMILVASAIVKLLGFDKIVINQVALSILLVLSFQSHSSYSLDRIRDTFVGCVIAILINMIVFPPDFTEKALKEVRTYTDYIAKFLRETGQGLKNNVIETEQDLQSNAAALLDDIKNTMDNMDLAERSIRYHPFIKKSQTKLQHFKKQLTYLYQGSANASNILQTIFEWENEGGITSDDRIFWANRLEHIARFYDSWKKEMDTSSPETDWEVKAEDDLLQWSTHFPLPQSKKQYRFAYALQNDTLNLLHIYRKHRKHGVVL